MPAGMVAWSLSSLDDPKKMRLNKRLLQWNYLLSSKSRQLKFDLFWSLIQPVPGVSLLNLGASAPHLGRTLTGTENALVEQPEQDPRWSKLRVVGCNLLFGDMSEYHRQYQKKGFHAIVADGCRLPFGDKSFDIVFSNAVIEHLLPAQQQIMAREIVRVGRSWFVTTPNFWYPIEMHHKLPFMQFLPRSVQGFVQRKWRTWPEGEPINLLTIRQFAKLLPGSNVLKLRVTFYPETLIAYRVETTTN
jgi:Methyltransferase domain